MSFMHKSRGAISIFLVIILLPMLTMGGVYVDMARTKLAQEVVASSADLALNTVMSQYDKDLKDFYGIIASAQDVSDVLSAAEGYFQSCMVSAGVDVSDAQVYVDNIMDAFIGDEDIRDLLQISVVSGGEGSNIIQPAKNGAMNNPAAIKSGIVEFMKYRSPIDGVAKMFEKIMKANVSEQLEDAGLEAKMIEAREKFYDAEKKLIKQAEKAYDAIKDYIKLSTHKNKKISEDSYLDDLSLFMVNPNGEGTDEGKGSFEKIFKEAHTRMVKSLYNTHNNDMVMSVNLLYASYFQGDDPVNVFSSSSKASDTKITNHLKDFNAALYSYVNAKNDLTTAWDGFKAYNRSTDWHVQYWVQLTNKVRSDYKDYVSAATTLREEYRELENAVDYAEEEAMDSKMGKPWPTFVSFPQTDNNNKLTLQQVYDSVTGYFNAHVYSELENGGSGCSAYRSINNAIANVKSEAGTHMNVNNVNYIYSATREMNSYMTDLENGEKKAKEAAKQVYALASLLADYKKAFQEWDKIANDPALDESEIANAPADPTAGAMVAHPDLTGGDRLQISYWKRVGIDHFTKESVTDLSGRLENIETVCSTFHKDLGSFKYNGTKINDITGFKSFRKASDLSASRIVVNNSQLNTYVDESFKFTVPKNIQRIEIWHNVYDGEFVGDGYYYISQRYHLNLDKTQHDLLDWMRAKFDGTPSGNPVSSSQSGLGYDINGKGSANDADDKFTDSKDDTKPGTGNGNNTKNDINSWGGAALPSKNKQYEVEDKDISAKISDAADYASSLFTDFEKTFGNSMVNLRDDLFTIDYVFSMFTHDTFDNEGYYSNVEESKQSKVTASNTPSYYTSEVKAAWTGSKEIQTPTLRVRNAANNWAYGSEIEYILYGNGTNAKNKTTAYANIFLIRYALDLAPVFKLYWNDQVVCLIANALQTFAYIPAGITKTVICLAITAGEAGVDVSYLKAGIPVLIFKSKKEDVFCNYQTIFSSQSENSDVLPGDRATLQYSDYLKIFFFMKLIGSGEQAIYSRIGDIIQINTAVGKGEQKTFTLAKSTVAYSFNATVQIAPMWSNLLAIDDLGDLSTSEGWRTISYKTISSY